MPGPQQLALLGIWLIVLDPADAVATTDADVGKAVVQVCVKASAPDLQRPWQRASMETRSGSCVVLTSRQILTNAHVVSNAVSIDVQRDGATERFPAKVAFVGHASDLALLTVEDPSFFQGSRHLDFGDAADKDHVEVLGFPTGGESLSITAGVVSL